MKSARFNKFLQANISVIIPVILTVLVIVVRGSAQYLAEYKQPGANIYEIKRRLLVGCDYDYNCRVWRLYSSNAPREDNSDNSNVYRHWHRHNISNRIRAEES